MDVAAQLADLGPLPSRMIIDGQRVEAATGARFESLDPGSGSLIAELPAGGPEDVAEAVAGAKAALKGPWAAVTPLERGRLLVRVAQLLRRDSRRLAKLECLDSGKPLGQATRDVERAAGYFDYYAGICDKLHGETIPLGRDRLCYTLRQPVGVTAHIVPWNVPLPIAARSLAPALACGNTAVVKPAEETPLTALALAELLLEAGLPPGVCNLVTGFGETAGAALAAHPEVAHITFTGSLETGRLVMAAAAEQVTAVTLELGGKSPLIVLADADLPTAVAGSLKTMSANAGQICSAGTRLVVERPLHEAMLEPLVTGAEALTLGHGLHDPELGPLISEAQRARVDRHVAGARSRGLALATGGGPAEVRGLEAGFFYQPTIFDAVRPEDAAAQEEIFGPVLCVQPVDSPEEALAVANGTTYGLAAGIYTRDIDRALALARDLEAGQVFINDYHSAGDSVPFGGTKASGIGRQKGLAALANYCEIKAVTARIR